MVAEQLFGVVPNFSEGRRTDVIDAICRALQVPGAHLVYRQADPDHNRLDTTVLGDRDAVARAALSGARVAVASIDMEHHTGGHPRMGAADAIPFMPVRGVTMDDCVELARSFAKELATSLDLPVYLYDRAALVPERASLADVRKGEFEGLRDAVARGERLPDFGPTRSAPREPPPSARAKPLDRVQRLPRRHRTRMRHGRIARSVRTSGGGSRRCGRSGSWCRNGERHRVDEPRRPRGDRDRRRVRRGRHGRPAPEGW